MEVGFHGPQGYSQRRSNVFRLEVQPVAHVDDAAQAVRKLNKALVDNAGALGRLRRKERVVGSIGGRPPIQHGGIHVGRAPPGATAAVHRQVEGQAVEPRP